MDEIKARMHCARVTDIMGTKAQEILVGLKDTIIFITAIQIVDGAYIGGNYSYTNLDTDEISESKTVALLDQSYQRFADLAEGFGED